MLQSAIVPSSLLAGGSAVDPDPSVASQEPSLLLPQAASHREHRTVEGAAGLGDTFKRLWGGAKEALRQATYYTMKKRAGIVGKEGLGPLIGHLHAGSLNLRIHLIGHSFGARVVSYALAGLPVDGQTQLSVSPVKSLVLLQGAFSHFAFADSLPHDPTRSGALKGMATRVDGPIIVTHSKKDLALYTYYPYASLAGRQDASDASDPLYQWGAMGGDGAQAVHAVGDILGKVGKMYPFARGKFMNLDGNAIITRGDRPSGAHSDIFHSEITWAVASGAGVV